MDSLKPGRASGGRFCPGCGVAAAADHRYRPACGRAFEAVGRP